MHQGGVAAADHLVRSIAGDGQNRWRHKGQDAIDADLADDVGGVHRQPAETLLAFDQRHLVVFLVGDVHQRADHGDDPAVVVAFGGHVGSEVAHLAVGACDADDDALGRMAGGGDRVDTFDRGGGVRVGHGAQPLQVQRRVGVEAIDAIELVRPGEFLGGEIQPPVAEPGRRLGQSRAARFLVSQAGRLDPAGLGHFKQTLPLQDGAGGPTQRQFVHDDGGQALESFDVGRRRRRARLLVDDAERAEVVAVRVGQHRTHIEAEAGLADDQGVANEPGVGAGVLDDHDRTGRLFDSVSAEGPRARGLVDVDAAPRLEPLAVLVDQRHQGDRRVEQVARQPGQAVERFFRRGVEDTVVRQRSQPRRFRLLHSKVPGRRPRPPTAADEGAERGSGRSRQRPDLEARSGKSHPEVDI